MRTGLALFVMAGVAMAPAAAQAADAVRPSVASVTAGAPLGTTLGAPARAGVRNGPSSHYDDDGTSTFLIAAAVGIGAFFLSHAVWKNTRHRCVSPGTGERVSCRG